MNMMITVISFTFMDRIKFVDLVEIKVLRVRKFKKGLIELSCFLVVHINHEVHENLTTNDDLTT